MARRVKGATKWLPIFLEFVEALRIDSKEETAADDSGTPLVLWQSQRRFLEELSEGLEHGVRSFVCLKSRQLGVTTISLAIDLFWLAMHPGIKGALVVDSEENREDFRRTLRRYIQSFPAEFFGDDFKLIKGGDNRTGMTFSNGSKLVFLVAGKSKTKVNWGEGKGFAFAHLTECGKYGSGEGIKNFEEALAQKNPDRLTIYESPLALNTPLATPSGWTTMGEVAEGDTLFDEYGKPCLVVGTSPIFVNRKCYRIEFNNGDHIIADADHKWRVAERRRHAVQKWQVRTLPTSALDPKFHLIDVTKPLDLPSIDLPIDPYLLGVWLGDGATAEPRITAGDDDVDEMRSILANRGHRLGVITKSKDRAPMFFVLGVRDKFIKLGLLGNKHIPEIYLRASESQRRELLAGLMDTDGSIGKTNYQCNFASTCVPLISGVSELLSSLGIKYVKSVNSVEGKIRLFPQGHYSVCKESWRLLFSEFPDRQVFNLTRKRRIQEMSRRHTWRKTKRIGIVSIQEVPSVPVKCVSVDSPSHLFLAGRTMIPTHNTANGFNHWRDRWLEAKSDIHTQRAFFIGWWANPNNSISKSDPRFTDYGLQIPSGEERELVQAVLDQYGVRVSQEQIAWYRWKQDKALKSGADVLDQNQPWTESQAFVATGFSFFQVRKIGQDMERLSAGGKDEAQFLAYRFECENEFLAMKMIPILDPEEMNLVQFRVWQPPVPNGKYVIGSDPAYGRNSHKDRHALSVWRCFADKLVQVAEFASADIEVKHFAWIMAFVAGAYSDCIVNYELGGPGRMIMSEWDHILGMLHSEAYAAKVKEWDWSDALNNARWYLYHRPDSMGPGFAYNFEATWRTQQELMHQYRGAYSTNELELKSVKLLEEMRIVVQDGEHIGAPESKNEDSKDDRVFAAALSCRAWLNWTRREMLSQGLMYETVMQEESGEMSPQAKNLNSIVFNFFTRKQEEIDNVVPDHRPKWMVQRGLA